MSPAEIDALIEVLGALRAYLLEERTANQIAVNQGHVPKGKVADRLIGALTDDPVDGADPTWTALLGQAIWECERFGAATAIRSALADGGLLDG